MKCKLVALIALILNLHRIGAVQKSKIENYVALASDIRDFYKSSSIVHVYDKYAIDWAVFENLIFAIIKDFSKNYIMSQVVDYKDVEYAIGLRRIGFPASASEPLYIITIRNDEDLEHFQVYTKDWNMSVFTWFVIIFNETSFDCENPAGNPFHLEMDTKMIVKCANSKSIKKYYSIFHNTTEVVDLAVWTPGAKLDFKEDDNQLQVKKNMKGITLRIAHSRASSNDDNMNVVNYLNYLIILLQEIGNFTSIVVVEDDELGYCNETTNEWIGLMKTMKNKEADIALVLLSLAVHRLEAVDFTMPLMLAKSQIYAKLPDAITVEWSAYFKMFNAYAWIMIGSAIVILSIVLALTKNKFRKPFFTMDLFFENLINVWGIYCQQGLSEIPPNTATQILYFSILLSSLVLFAVYSATITSYIAVMTVNLPFSTYDEFFQYPYKVGVIRGSRDEALVYSDDWLLGRLERRLIKRNNLPINAYEGCRQACNESVAFYTNDVMYRGISKTLPCILGSMRLPRDEFQSIALSKDSPYLETINYNIMRLMDNGLLKRLKSQYFYKYSKLPVTRPTVIDFFSVIPILLIWMIGAVTSLAIFFIEIILFNWRQFLY